MEYQTLQKKLDCFLLTAKISKSLATEIESIGKRFYNNELQKDILANVATIKGSEDRILTRLDYWIGGKLTNEHESDATNVVTSMRRKHTVSNGQGMSSQIWDLEVVTSGERESHTSPEQEKRVRKDTQLSRWSSAASPSKNRWKRPGRAGRALHQDNISMFAYNSKSRLDANEDLPAGEILRKSMFSRFGTLNSKKMKMFFSKDNHDEQHDAKSRKSVKGASPLKPLASGEKSKPFFFKFRKKDKLDFSLDTNLRENISTGIRSSGKKRRPKSVVSNDFNLDDIIFSSSNTGNIEGSSPDKHEDKNKTFRERLRSMPVFYVPLSSKGPLKVFK